MKKGNRYDNYHGSIGLHTRSGLDFQGPISEGKIKALVPRVLHCLVFTPIFECHLPDFMAQSFDRRTF